MKRTKVEGFKEDMSFNVGESIMKELDGYLSFHMLKNSSRYTIKNINYNIGDFAEWMLLNHVECFSDCNKIEKDVVKEYIAHLQNVNRKVSSINTSIKYLKAFFNYLAKIKHIKRSPFASGEIHLMTEDKKIKYVISEKEFKILCDSLDLTMFKDVVTYTFLHLAYYTAARINEIANLQLFDIDLQENVIFVRKSKGRTERTIPIHPKLKKVLVSYMNIRGDSIEEKALLVSVNNRKLSRESLSRKLKETVRNCGLNEGITAHSFRRSAISRLIASNVDMKTVMEISGHSDVRTIADRYIEISNEQKFNAINKL